MNYKVGDRVVFVKDINPKHYTILYGVQIGDEATVIVSNDNVIGIEFDKRIKTIHTCGSNGRAGYCLWCEADCVALVDNAQEISDEDFSAILSI